MSGKKPTVRDIAKKADVSITTVSRFLNQDFGAMSDATKQRIHDAVIESGYVNTRVKLKRTIAIVIPGLSDPFFAMVVENLTMTLEQAGFSTQLCLTGDSIENERRMIQSLLIPTISGIIYMSTVTSEDNCYELLKKAEKPFVVLDSYLSEYNVPAMAFSNGVYAMYEVTKYLLEAGHRSIAYLSGLRQGMFENNRYQGYVQAQLDWGLAVNPALVKLVGFSIEDGMNGFRELQASGEAFTAVICESDQMAAGVYKLCQRMGISIPEELSVVGFNNSLIAEVLEPPLDSVDQQLDQMAYYAVDMLKRQIQGENLTDRVKKIPSWLVIRNSVRSLTEGSGKENV